MPHVLVITCHDLGRFLGCYGVATVRTPNVDRLAGEGTRLAAAFAPASGCSPARAALATGRYPHANGVMGLTHPPFGWDLFPNELHLAQILGRAGYRTHLFGFQHVSPDDERPGFEVRHAKPQAALAARVAAEVAALLRDDAGEQPLYIEVNLEEPHRPYDQGAAPDTSRGITVPGYLPEGPAAAAEMAALQGAVAQADAGVGAMLRALDESGRRDNTIVLFAADHGIAMPRAKCTLYDPGIEVAVILRGPRTGAPGTVIDDLIGTVDLLPTLLDALDLPIPAGVQGRTFFARLHGRPYQPRTSIFAEKTYHSYYDPMRAVRTAGWKYIRNYEPTFAVEIPGDIAVGAIYRAHVECYTARQHPPVELYDLRHDPLEQHNLAGKREVASEEARLAGLLAEWMEETRDPLLAGPIPTPGLR